ncbi:MAG: GerAB/ArcD/ProY family transporter [Ignavibacteriales bacterium]
MQNNSIITTRQLYYLFVLSIIPINLLYIPGEPTNIVNQSAWIAAILATIIAGAFLYYPLAVMGSHFPGLTIFQYSDKVAGRYFGKIFGGLILYNIFELHCWTLRETAIFSSIIFPRTPDIVFLAMISLATSFAAVKGLQLIGRLSDIFFPLGLIIFIFLTVMGASQISLDNLLPIVNSSPGSMVRATIVFLDWVTVGLSFGAMSAFVDHPERLKAISMYGTAAAGLILVVFSIVTIGVYGTELVKLFSLPFLMLARSINIGFIFERVEALLVAGWLAWLFMMALIMSYVNALGIAQMFRLKDYRSLVLPETILAIAYSMFQYKSYIEQAYLFGVAHLYYLSLSLALPLLLWIIYLVRFRKGRSYNKSPQLPG